MKKELRCPHCHRYFRPDPHNARQQRVCSRKPCQRARNRESCRRWRRNNPDYFKKDTGRTQGWRLLHPCYWRRERRRALSVDILLPVYSGERGVGLQIRNRHGIALQHVVIPQAAEWQRVWWKVGTTLQNVVGPPAFRAYRGGHEQENGHAAGHRRRF